MRRKAGVLLSVSSLPSREGIGTLGEGAYAFVDFLAAAGFRVWQVLPLTPTREGNSPYSSVCENALNPLFIDAYDLLRLGLLSEDEIPPASGERVDYASFIPQKDRLLRLAFSRFDRKDPDFVAFEKKGEYRDYAVFSTLSEVNGDKPFYEWADGYDRYDESRVHDFIREHFELYLYHVFTQYIFDVEWKRLKEYANAHGIEIFGDMPIYVAMNSAEVYFHPEMFLFDEDRHPKKVAGVPPDYFNSEGQLWGNPLYDWERMSRNDYAWWRERIRRELNRFDILRIDHFRGLDRFYAIDADAADAKHGTWTKGPGAALFDGLVDLPIVAEDLGYIDESLREMLQKVGFPGMKVYEFGLDADPWSEHKPANYAENVVAYTGTHDNMPFCGYLDAISREEKGTAAKTILIQATVLGVPIAAADHLKGALRIEDADGARVLQELTAPYPADLAAHKEEMHRRVMAIEGLKDTAFAELDSLTLTEIAFETLLRSRACLAMVPMQDLLALGADSRMNTPALVSEENWAWRLNAAYLKKDRIARLREKLQAAERL